jgi:hypothetical protein
VGEPSLVETEPISAGQMIGKEAMGAMGGAVGPPSKGSVGIDIISPTPPAASETAPGGTTEPAIGSSPFGRPGTAGAANGADPNELKPNVADPNELKPSDNGTDQTLPPPPQVNEIHQGSSSNANASDDSSTLASDSDISSSKKKKKKGLKKLIPF